jgi:transposase
MRGENGRQRAILVVFDAEQRVPKGHPLRRIKALADAALAQLSPRFDEMYSAVGRPSIPPERLLKASLLMALHTIRSERMFCEQRGYNFCSAGFWTWRRTRRASTTRRSRATARGCWSTR